VAKRRQRRRREKEQRHAPKPAGVLKLSHGQLEGWVDRLVYSGEHAAEALGISLAMLDRRVVPAIATAKTEWGALLIPASELERYLAERTRELRTQPRQAARSGRKPTLSSEIVARIRREHTQGASLAEIARGLTVTMSPLAKADASGGSQRYGAALLRLSHGGSAHAAGAQR
jgi:hypothetical protein